MVLLGPASDGAGRATHPRARFGALLLAAAIVAGGAAGPRPAWACGGVFTATSAAGLEPIDQAAERILFEIAEGTVTATFQLQFQGDPRDFAWIIPVPAVPTVTEADLSRLKAIDQASALSVRLPQPGACLLEDPEDPGAASGCSCGGTESIASRPPPAPGDLGNRPPVRVYASSLTARFAYDVIESAYTPVLVEWLSDHGYHLGERMLPELERYNVAGTKFLALRLRPEAGIHDVVPISVTLPGDQPMIPLALTKVAAQPYFGLLVLILADQTYLPQNYVSIPPRSGEILFDSEGTTSYFEWVARSSAEANGHFFSTEFLGERPAALDGVSSARFLSRYYTRISPEQMTLDPGFRPHPNQGIRQANVLDLSQEESLYDCATVVDARKPSACGFNYCGSGATCGEVDGQASCRCGEGTTAALLEGPDGVRRVSCIAAENPAALSPAELADLDPCANVSCGMGTCAAKGRLATCTCEPGAVALAAGGALTCVPAPSDMVTYGPGAGRESRSTPATTAALHLPTTSGGVWALALVAWFLRRRR